MAVQVKIFGQLTEIVNSHELTITDISDTNSLINELNKRYPSLSGSRYIVAVNKQTVTSNTVLSDDSVVALLPPFSGG
jgi:sulfur-carrier protein